MCAVVQVEKSVARGRGGIYLGDPKTPGGCGSDFRALPEQRASDFFVLPDCCPKIIHSLPKDLPTPPQGAKMEAVLGNVLRGNNMNKTVSILLLFLMIGMLASQAFSQEPVCRIAAISSPYITTLPATELGERSWIATVSYTHLTLPTICSV